MSRCNLCLVTALVLAIALGPTDSHAQTRLYVGGGGSFPTGDFSEYADTGWQFFGGVLFPVGPDGLRVGIEGNYGENKVQDDVLDAKTNPYGAMGVVTYDFQTSGSMAPYVYGGLGLLVNRFSSDLLTRSESQFGYQLGAGLAFGLGTSALFLEGRYTGASNTPFFGLNGGFAFAVGGR